MLESGDPNRALVDIDKVIAYYQTVPDAASNCESARLCRHDVLLELERFEAVVDDCDCMLAGQVANGVEIRITRGIALTAIGRNTESLDELNEVISELDGEDSQTQRRALSARVNTCLSIGNVEQAVVDIQRLQTQQGLTTYNMSLMGLVEIQTNDFRAALNCYQKAASLDPSIADTYFKLALIQSGCPEARFRDGTQAEVNARKACALAEWNDWNCISVLAAAKAELGDFDQAVEFTEWAPRLAPHQEKEDRQKRLEQYRNREPFRIDDTLPRMLLRRNASES